MRYIREKYIKVLYNIFSSSGCSNVSAERSTGMRHEHLISPGVDGAVYGATRGN